MSIPKKVHDRLADGIKRFQPILAAAKARDIGESDTVTIIKDMLADVFGYDKYAEVTTEFAIRSTFCDLAIKLDGRLQKLIEVKAIGIELKDPHVKQAVDYAANQGCDWVVLSNGTTWRIYKIAFTKPIDAELVVEFDFQTLNHRNEAHIEWLYLICKEGWAKSVLGEYHTQKQALSRFFLGAIILSEPIVDAVRRELRRLSPDVRISSEEIARVIKDEVIKREVLEGEKADGARRKVSSVLKKFEKQKAEAKGQKPDELPTQPETEIVPDPVAAPVVEP